MCDCGHDYHAGIADWHACQQANTVLQNCQHPWTFIGCGAQMHPCNISMYHHCAAYHDHGACPAGVARRMSATVAAASKPSRKLPPQRQPTPPSGNVSQHTSPTSLPAVHGSSMSSIWKDASRDVSSLVSSTAGGGSSTPGASYGGGALTGMSTAASNTHRSSYIAMPGSYGSMMAASQGPLAAQTLAKGHPAGRVSMTGSSTPGSVVGRGPGRIDSIGSWDTAASQFHISPPRLPSRQGSLQPGSWQGNASMHANFTAAGHGMDYTTPDNSTGGYEPDAIASFNSSFSYGMMGGISGGGGSGVPPGYFSKGGARDSMPGGAGSVGRLGAGLERSNSKLPGVMMDVHGYGGTTSQQQPGSHHHHHLQHR